MLRTCAAKCASRIFRVNFHVTSHKNDRIRATRQTRRRRRSGLLFARESKYVCGIVLLVVTYSALTFPPPPPRPQSKHVFGYSDHSLFGDTRRAHAQKCLTTFSVLRGQKRPNLSASCAHAHSPVTRASTHAHAHSRTHVRASLGNSVRSPVSISVISAYVFEYVSRVNNRAKI